MVQGHAHVTPGVAVLDPGGRQVGQGVHDLLLGQTHRLGAGERQQVVVIVGGVGRGAPTFDEGRVQQRADAEVQQIPVDLAAPGVVLAGLVVDARRQGNLLAGAEEFDLPVPFLHLAAETGVEHHGEADGVGEFAPAERLVGEEVEVAAVATGTTDDMRRLFERRPAVAQCGSGVVGLREIADIHVDDVQIAVGRGAPLPWPQADVAAAPIGGSQLLGRLRGCGGPAAFDRRLAASVQPMDRNASGRERLGDGQHFGFVRYAPHVGDDLRTGVRSGARRDPARSGGRPRCRSGRRRRLS